MTVLLHMFVDDMRVGFNLDFYTICEEVLKHHGKEVRQPVVFIKQVEARRQHRILSGVKCCSDKSLKPSDWWQQRMWSCSPVDVRLTNFKITKEKKKGIFNKLGFYFVMFFRFKYNGPKDYYFIFHWMGFMSLKVFYVYVQHFVSL